MKKTVFPLLLLVAALCYLPCCISCTDPNNEPQEQEEEPTPQEPENPQPENPGPVTPQSDKPQPGDYQFVASPFKGSWEAGDKIHVHGSYAPAAQVITLKEENLSEDGTVATVHLEGDLFNFMAAPDGLYAAWPAEAVQEEDGLLDSTTGFTRADILLAQAYLEGNVFKFDDASAAIIFSVSGDYDAVIIAGEDRVGLRFTTYSNAHSSAETSFAKVVSDGYPFREEEFASDGNPFILWFPGGVTLKSGFTLYFGKDDVWTASYTYDNDATLKAGKKLDLGDITGDLVDYEGVKPHMPEVTKMTKYAVKFNELSGLCVDLSGDFLWVLGDGSEIAQVSIDGELLDEANLKTTTGSTIDSEGLSINYDTGDILISGEPNVVCKIPYEGVGNIFEESTFKGVESLFKIDDAKGFGNAGAEGCTYYKDNFVYVGTQTGSYLYLVDLETGEVQWRKNLREKFPYITEIAGLSYDPLTDWLWVIDSESHRFFALSGDAEKMMGMYLLKTKSNEESVCVDHKNGCVWVGDDYGSTSYIFRYDMSCLDDFLLPAE